MQSSTDISNTNNTEDTKGNIVFANQPINEMLNNRMDINYSRNQLEGEQIHPGDMSNNQQIPPNAINSDNSKFIFKMTLFDIYIRISGIPTDITESHENMQSLTTGIKYFFISNQRVSMRIEMNEP